MNIFECTYEQFKQRAKEFHDAIPTLDYDGLENGYKALGMSYLNMTDEMWQHSASIVLKLMLKEMVERQMELDNGNCCF